MGQLDAGPEVGYIVRGDVAMEFDNRPTLTLRAGDPFMIRGASSTTRGTSGPSPRRCFSTYVVDETQPLATLFDE